MYTNNIRLINNNYIHMAKRPGSLTSHVKSKRSPKTKKRLAVKEKMLEVKAARWAKKTN